MGETMLGMKKHWLTDPVVGLIVGAGLAYCTHALLRRGTLPGSLRVFEHRTTLWIGAFAYSLYLVHVPTLKILRMLIPFRGSRRSCSFASYCPSRSC